MATGAGKLQDRTRSIVRPLSRLLWKINCIGFELLPRTGPAILCPNHVSFLDSAFLMLCVPRRISFVGKAEYLDSWKTKYLFPAMGMIPIDRSGGSASSSALEAAERVLRRGELFGIFPEGTRSRDGVLYKGHTGAARLAMNVGCPLFPVGIVGTADIQAPGARLPKLWRSCEIHIGEPIDPRRHRSDNDRLALREITDEVMYEIRAMTGQEYRDRYATKKAEDVPVEPARVLHVGEAREREVVAAVG
jgi:1-acyl-sn-glycerol-3-phosphate acyltransferase